MLHYLKLYEQVTDTEWPFNTGQENTKRPIRFKGHISIIDDMLIHAKTQEEQDRRLKAVLKSLSNTPSDLTEETRFIGISLIER